MYALLKDLEINKPLDLRGYFSWEEKNSKGKQYLVTRFTDIAGDTATFTVFPDKHSKEFNIFKTIPQCYCQVTIVFLGESNGYPQYKFSNVVPLLDPNKGVLVSIENLCLELEEFIETIKDSTLKNAVMKAYTDNKDMIQTCPASMTSGYSYEGGLLAQMVRVCRSIKAICQVYNSWDYNLDSTHVLLDYDSLIAAAIMSDMGAINYYFINNNKVEKKFCGKLSDKESLCMFFSDMYLMDLFKENSDKFFLFRHILENSNSKQYQVSVPRTVEANILASIREMDKKISNFEFLYRLPTMEEFVKLNGKEYCLMPFPK